MDANLLRQQQQQQQQQQLSSAGLMRYRSAPSTLLANFVEGCDDFIPSHPRSSSPEGEGMFARFMNCGGDDSGSSDLREIRDKSPPAPAASANNNRNSQFVGSEQNGFRQASQMMYQTPPRPQPQPQAHMVNHSNSAATDNAYNGVVSSMGSGGNCSNLIRHSSSPAGLFSHLNVENGYAVMRGMGNFRAGNGSNGEAAASTSRLKGQMSFSSGPPSSSGLMSQISEIGSESIGATNGDSGNSGNRYIHNFPVGSWDDSALENITGLKRARDGNKKMISENGEVGSHTPGLTHHFSLPKNSAEMAAILQFQDSVPCKIRAKRGCATHPRSIAERVRRTRISERMRKLQELVPNMDKQTNTADMLDLAVDHIKDLQKQVKSLSENRANCTCSSKQKAY